MASVSKKSLVTTHILVASKGIPGKNIPVKLEFMEAADVFTLRAVGYVISARAWELLGSLLDAKRDVSSDLVPYDTDHCVALPLESHPALLTREEPPPYAIRARLAYVAKLPIKLFTS
ncbi:hypothetical protein BC938DRAFT_472257 [Jimgerdemannia flammicorona]|uniref:Uncharacterized protein n=1 Tax=Jimgerdemannia flammicorona TaxID=994334 RepID=A0A433Q6H1_9FUNG|nr:hypothetical protein BC938DRAFT_472257 [Jimgerdemannia flammicorona]